MFKVFVLISLCIAGIHGQELAAPGGEPSAAAEPYSYGYQTDSHGASEQRDPSGRVTGSYMLADADGRERRVEYYADETGFHAKVQTNEVGTKAENSADVEMLASPPSEGQLVYQTSVQQAAAPQFSQFVQQSPPTSSVQTTSIQGQTVPLTTSSVSYSQQPSYSTNTQSVGYYPGSQVVSGYRYVPGYSAANSGQQYVNQGAYTNYNNHLPSQYYRSVQTSGVQPQPQGWVSGSSRYVSSQVAQPYAGGYQGGYQTGYQVGGYQTVPSGISYTTSQVGPAVSSRTVTTSRKVSTGVPSSSFQILKSRR